MKSLSKIIDEQEAGFSMDSATAMGDISRSIIKHYKLTAKERSLTLDIIYKLLSTVSGGGINYADSQKIMDKISELGEHGGTI